MNKNIYRLIFSKRLGMLVPASEVVRARGCKSSGRRMRSLRRAMGALLGVAVAHALPAVAEQPAGLVRHETRAWVNANIDAARTSANQMTVRQTASKAVLNWQQLNLNRGQTLNFDQGGNRSWAALNRIYDASPSVISGNVNADGHVYFVNQNGIIFGNGAQINVGSLTATSLDNIANDDIVDRFNDGIVSDEAAAAFQGIGGFVRVEQGAAISAATGGRVMLLAPSVENSGVIVTPEGQTILAAGQKVFLGDSTDPAGLLVEVESGGTARNLGDIVAKRGNVSLVGLAVNQEGRITASTSVRANGSIHLMANTRTAGATDVNRDGVVTLAQGSQTVVEVETSNREEVLDAQSLNPSRVQIEGKTVSIDGEIVAHGGQVDVNPKFSPWISDLPPVNGIVAEPVARETLADTRIYLGEHALIDVSGVDASAPMSRNQLELELFSDQLKDTPILRGGPLFGHKIYVDARNLSSDQSKNLLDFGPAIALKTRTIAERLSGGGKVTLNASPMLGDSGEILMADGSRVDVSGGSVTYEAGYLRESSLLYNGGTTLVSKANRNTPYQAVADDYSRTDRKWGVTRHWNLGPNTGRGTFVSSYTDGRNAGSINLAGKYFVLGAEFKANTLVGSTQRKTPPIGGGFSLVQNGLASLDSPVIRFVNDHGLTLPGGFSATGDVLAADFRNETQIATSLFDNGFGQVEVSGGISSLAPFPTLPTFSSIVVDGDVIGQPDGKLTLLSYAPVAINADITLPSGELTVQGDGVRVGENVRISTAGLFTNDEPGVAGALAAPVAPDGGDIRITSKDIAGDTITPLTLGAGSRFDASAGAWLDAVGKFNQGKAGNISLPGVSGVEPGQFQSFGFDKGGSLTLGILADVNIGGGPGATPHTQWLPESFFSTGGFSAFSVTASSGTGNFLASEIADPDLTVVAGTVLQPQMQTLVRLADVDLLPSGTSMSDVAQPELLPAARRTPVSLSLAAFDELKIADNAIIRLDAPGYGLGTTGGTISLNSQRQLSILGDLVAPAGTINATVTINQQQPINNDLTLFVGENATLSAAGHYAVAMPDGKGILNATVLNGGKIKLESGTLTVLKAGSVLDISGVSGEADVAMAAGLQRQMLDGSAGSITIAAPFVLDGELKGAAQGTGAGGTLDLTMKSDGKVDVSGIPLNAGAMNITQERSGELAAGLNPGDSYADTLVLQNEISASQIVAGGFDRLNARINRQRGDDKITLASGLDLQVPVALFLSAPRLEVAGSGMARVAASNVTLSGVNNVVANAPVAGSAGLQVAADFIDLIGPNVLTGIASAEFSASNDIRGRNSLFGTAGSLKTPGDLVLRARQIYPSTLSQFTFEAVDIDANPATASSIRVESSGASPRPVLSANGSLTLKADDIVQGGVLRAPLGTVTLDAADTGGTITMMPGSLTSVSADGQLIPYGLTGLSGLNFAAPLGEQMTNSSEVPGAGAGTSFSKLVTLDSDRIDMRPGATVDLSGSGDTLVYEYINGIGGTTDILGQAGVYAIMPSAQGEYAPIDPNYQLARTIKVSGGVTSESIAVNDLKLGDAVYLSGIPNLPDGTYTLLPGRYALLPGAFMVQTSSSQALPGQSLAQLDGSTLVSGYRTTLEGSSRDAVFSTFRVTDGKVFRENQGTKDFKGPAEYRLNSGNDLHARMALAADMDVPRLAADAGQLVLNADSRLALGGTLMAGKQEGARGALVDIVADRIKVVSTEGAELAGTVQVTASSLNSLEAESLLLGGGRTQGADGLDIATVATEVSFANDAGHALQVSELIATARDVVKVENGAAIRAVSDTAATGEKTLHASGDGALMAVSAVNDLTFVRSDATGATGSLIVDSGAMVEAGRSLVLDSTSAAMVPVLAGNVNVGPGGSATLGADLVQLGSPAVVGGLLVDNALIGSLGDLALLTLNSKQNLEVHGATALGSRDLDLTFNTSGIKGILAVGESVDVSARTLVLKNTTGTASVAAAGNGALNLSAQTITIEGRDLAGSSATPTFGIGGFAAVNFNAAGEAKISGVGETRINAATTTMTSTRMTAESGAANTIKVEGALNTAAAAGTAVLPAADGLGGSLKLEAASLNLGGVVDLPSGHFTAIASSGDLNVLEGAGIKAASIPVRFDRFTRHTPGGAVTLEATAGNVNVASGATLDVSGGRDAGSDADAGLLTIRAAGATKTANVNGSLLGTGGNAGGEDGRFVLDVGTIGDFSALNNKLNAGGFTGSREMRVRSGDVTVSGVGGDAVRAERIVVAADGGMMTVTGEIDATADKNGFVGLYARDGITLGNTARLKAVSTGAGVKGGTVELAATGVTVSPTATATTATNATTGGFLDLQAGSDIDVSGGTDGAGGAVHMRAPRLAGGLASAGNTDINIRAVAGTLTGASSVRAEGFRVYSDSSIATADFSTTGAATSWYKESEAFLKSVADDAGVGLKRLGKYGDATFTIVPGVEVRNTGGDVALANDWTLFNWRFDRDDGVGVTASTNLNSGLDTAGHSLLAGVLTLRAANNLNLNGTLNDGFSSVNLGGGTIATVQGLSAWSYNLIGGADFSSANVMGTSSAASSVTGNVALANNKGVRTGMGGIRVGAGGNLNMGNDGSVIYTAGRTAATLAGFTLPNSNARYLTDGGDLEIRVQNDINGKTASGNKQQTVNDWLNHQGGGSGEKQVSWWVRPDMFRQGVGALGGGDVTIQAGRNISSFSAAAATTARYASDTSFVENGGGDVTVTAGNDIASGVYYAGRGEVRIRAGGEIKESGTAFGTTIALQDAEADVFATKGAYVHAAFNPTVWTQGNGSGALIPSSNPTYSYFLSMREDGELNVNSLVGSVRLGSAGQTTLSSNSTISASSISDNEGAGAFVFPSTVEATSFGGDVTAKKLTLLPSANGSLSLLAAGNVRVDQLYMSDADSALVPAVSSVSRLVASGEQLRANLNATKTVLAPLQTGHALTPIHRGDSRPVEIVARSGSVTANADNFFAKPVYLRAAEDVALRGHIQHSGNGDISVINAGRDFSIEVGSTVKLQVGGPGELLVQAGRNVNLGKTEGVLTIGNNANPNLPDKGTSITVLAGAGEQGADLASYIATYLDPTGAGPAVLRGDADKLSGYRKTTADALASYMREVTGNASLSEAEAVAQYLSPDMDRNLQAVFAYRHFSSELLAAARTSKVDRGDNAIGLLFPDTRDFGGDLSLFQSQVRTLSGGSIDLLAPGGLINVGVPVAQGTKVGIVTEFGGEIRAFAESGFQVEQSKVITQYGSDITVWVNNGDIDAGRGSKSSVSAPVRDVGTDVDGNTHVEIKGSAVGSGIRADSYDLDGPDKPGVAPKEGAVALIVPRGILDLGEAGIGGGNVLIVANDVVGFGGIDSTGSVTGAPAADTGSLGGALSGTSIADAAKSVSEDVSRQAAQSAASAFSAKHLLPSFISVEVIGLGD